MSLVSTPTPCGWILSDSDWPSGFLSFISDMEYADGGKYSFLKKEALFLGWVNSTSSSGGSFTIVIQSAGVSITSSFLANIIVTGMLINDAGKNTGFYKGNIGDTTQQQTQSDTLTFSDGTTLGVGDIVTLFY